MFEDFQEALVAAVFFQSGTSLIIAFTDAESLFDRTLYLMKKIVK